MYSIFNYTLSARMSASSRDAGGWPASFEANLLFLA